VFSVVPSTLKTTWSTPRSSEAETSQAASCSVALIVAPAAGTFQATVGAVVSPVGVGVGAGAGAGSGAGAGAVGAEKPEDLPGLNCDRHVLDPPHVVALSTAALIIFLALGVRLGIATGNVARSTGFQRVAST
jgi:hypothetical protein